MQRAWIEINENNLIHNLKQLESKLPSSCKIAPVIKANAYGHGATLIAKVLEKHGYDVFCVACLQEAIELRKANIKGDILILGYTEVEQAKLLEQYDLIQTVLDYDYATKLNAMECKVRTHLKVDTGMHRLGIPYDHFDEFYQACLLKNLHVEGIFTHFSCDESKSLENQKFTYLQQERLEKVYRYLAEKGMEHLKMHSLASYGVVHYSSLKSDYARCGIAMYGLLSNRQDLLETDLDLKPILTLKAKIAHIEEYPINEPIGYGGAILNKNSKIATLSIGYADGVKRGLSDGNGYVIVHGKKAKIVGKICMDQMMVDISDIEDVVVDDEAILLSNDKESMSIYDWAEQSCTITNEIVSDLSARLNRVVR